MTLNQTTRTPRRKAVWGPKRTLIAGALVLVGLSGTAGAAPRGSDHDSSRHNRKAPVAMPGVHSARVKNYKVDDLTRGGLLKTFPYGDQRVAKFVDFVNGHTLPYDDNGHGTHVSGIIAGNGYDSLGERAGIAPRASIVSLKVLDANGEGTISNI